jgi:hypothetical protein
VLFETSGYLSDLRFSPQGDRIAFFEHPVKYDDRGSIDVVDLAGHNSVLSDGYQSEEGWAWAPSGKSIYFSGQLGDGFNLIVYQLTLPGKERRCLRPRMIFGSWTHPKTASCWSVAANIRSG